VVMNEDASAGVDVDVKLGVWVPFLESLGSILVGSGLIIGLIGGLIIYYAVVRR